MNKERLNQIIKHSENKVSTKGNLFPISATHRKELRELAQTNIGTLKRKISIIRTKKKEEYVINNIKNVSDLSIKIEPLQKKAKLVQKLLSEINKEILKIGTDKLSVNNTYIFGYYITNTEFISKLIEIKIRPNYKVVYLEKEFDERFKDSFTKVLDELNNLEQQFEESLLFNDLHKVKFIYDEIKKADKFLKFIEHQEMV